MVVGFGDKGEYDWIFVNREIDVWRKNILM